MAKTSTLVLIHGSWHAASAYGLVIPHLAALGHAAVAVDLPGHGLGARFPRSFLQRPLDAQRFAAELSPLADISLDDYADCVIRAIGQLRERGHDKLVLVGHSLAGATLTCVAERIPEQLSRLVYLTAWLPFNGKSIADMRQFPEAAGSEVAPLLRSEPAAARAARIDFDSPDAAYQSAIQSAMYHDASEEAFVALRRSLTPDEPIGPQLTPIHKTAAAWGSVPRHYIKCLHDRALMPAMAQRMIEGADSESPGNPTQVHALAASHSPFLSMPGELAALLSRIAAD